MIGEDTGTVETESFADLLDAHSQAAERFRQGMRVKCVIVAITTDTIFVSTGDKVDGIVERKEFEDADGNLSCVVGDELELYVTVATPHEVRLSKAFSSGGGVSVLKEALESGVPVEGKVMATVKGGYSVEVMKRRAFCPFSQIDSRPVETPDAMLGQTFLFLVTKVEQEGRNVIVSRRALLERENAASRESFLATVNTGDIIEAEVVRLAPFGAFVELHPGVDGLVHISELAWSRVQQASELLTVGDKVKVKLISIANDEKSSKISLSIRQVTEDPWLNLSAHVELGQVLTGKVQRLAQFGAFVELMPGVEGLIHLSEFSYEQRVHKAQDMLTIGDQISVKIKEIDVEKKRISLSMREAAGDPWADVEERFTVGSSVQATIEKREKFGVFIKLSAGVVGLLPGSVLATAKKGIYENIAPGDTIEVVINNIDKSARKISLGIPADNVGELPIMNSGAAPADTFANKARENNKPNNNNNNSRPNNRNDRGNDRGNAPSRDNRDAKPRRDRNDGGGDKSWKEHTPKNDNFGASLGLVLQAARDKKK